MNPEGRFETQVRLALGGPDLTWAGKNPFEDGLCLGFDNGTLIFSATNRGYTSKPERISPSESAINAVAGIGIKSLAVSTRSEVTFIQAVDETKSTQTVFAGGAHGVVATKSGYFVAPLGAKGVLFAKPSDEPDQVMRLLDGSEGKLYFYRMVALHNGSGTETLVFANRREGVGVSTFDENSPNHGMHTMKFEGVDVVDVCGVAPNSLAAIGISRNGELLLIRDTSKRENPTALVLHGIEGRVCRVLANAKHLFVLTSKALYVWTYLVERLFFGGKPSPDTLPLVIPMEAVDMTLFNDSYLIIVLAANGLLGPTIKELERQPIENDPTPLRSSMEFSRRAKLEELHPAWQTRDVKQSALVGVG
jgi:hypothetical protein